MPWSAAVGTVIGLMLGLLLWVAYRPHLESSSHHLIGMFALPWVVIGPAMGIAFLATIFAASRPARSIRRVPIVTALSGRPAPPKQIRRSTIPGIVVLVVGFLLLGSAGAQRGGGGAPQLVFGLLALVVGLILLAPMLLTVFAKLFKWSPISLKMAVRDLARYRSRSASALSAVSLAVLIAVIICIVAAARYGNTLDYAGPNLSSDQMVIYTPTDPTAPALAKSDRRTTLPEGSVLQGPSALCPATCSRLHDRGARRPGRRARDHERLTHPCSLGEAVLRL